MEEYVTGIPSDSPENIVRKIRLIIEEEASRLHISVNNEKHETRDSVEEIILSLKFQGSTFRLFLSYTLNAFAPVNTPGLTIGHGHIEKECKLMLRAIDGGEDRPQFAWFLEALVEGKDRRFPRGRTLDGPLLRQLIRARLGVQPRP